MNSTLKTAAFLVGALTGCDAGYGASMAAKAEVQLENKAGNTTLVGQAGLKTATVVITPRGLSEDEVTAHFKVSQALGDGVVQVLVERLKSDGHNTDMFLDLTVTVPPDGFFQVDNPSGDAEVRDMTGGGQVRALGGSVRVTHVTGTLEAESRDNLDIAGHTCADPLRALAKNGDITVAVVKECHADVRAAGHDGVDVKDVDFGGVTAPDAVLGTIQGKGQRIDLAAEKGSITLKAE